MKRNTLLSTLWIFLVVNFIFCDVFTLFHSESLKAVLTGEMDGMIISQEFLLAFAVIMELAMVMILLSRILPYKINRTLNIVISAILAIIQAWSLIGANTLHYYFFSAIEITTCISIAIIALKWRTI